MTELTIFSVATDRYLEFWLELLNSAEHFIDKDVDVQWILFTNRKNEIPKVVVERLGANLVKVPFESAPWPMPTLLRYELLAKAADKVKGEIVMHLDADMLFVSSLSKNDLEKLTQDNNITLVRHPGFFRPRYFSRVEFYIKHPRYVLSDLKSFVLNGGIGSWEKSNSSLAFVPRNGRKVYVCGAIWLGKSESIIDLCRLLSERINKDLSNNIIAKFHDESHLNWFAANNVVKLLTPKYCFEGKYPQLKHLVPIIIAVDKPKELKKRN
jgi:hypothetical protein